MPPDRGREWWHALSPRRRAWWCVLEAMRDCDSGRCGDLPGAASLGTAATPFAEAQSVPPDRRSRVARPEPSAKGVVVRFRGY